jgi:hypothetical protein
MYSHSTGIKQPAGYHTNKMGYLRTYRPRPKPVPVHTCEEPSPVFLEIRRPELDALTPAKRTVAAELVPFGNWTAEEVYFHCLRRKAEHCIGYIASDYLLEKGRVLQLTNYRNNRDQ